MQGTTLFWDVDTQYDFMMPDGRLYVEGADRIIPVVSEIRATALDHGCSIVASMDWHSEANPELSENPDFQSTFPPHCMAGSPGARRVGYLGNLPIHNVDLEPQNPNELAKRVHEDQFHIAIRKEALDVFSNPNTVGLLNAFRRPPGQIVVFGVALDFCVKAACEGLVRFPHWRVVLVRDATKAVTTAEPVLNGLERLGVQFTDFSQLQETIRCG